jgi:hypothetical protein
MSDPIYHFTDTARLPWIITSGELRPVRNKIDPASTALLWATTDPRSDRSASAMSGSSSDAYRAGKSRLVRFALDPAAFFPWCDLKQHFPDYPQAAIDRLERNAFAMGQRDTSVWYCRAEPLRVAGCTIATRSRADPRWRPLGAPVRIYAVEGGAWLGVEIEGLVYFSRQSDGPDGEACYETRSGRPIAGLEPTAIIPLERTEH